VFGTSGIIAKLLALPVFCIIIIITKNAAHRIHLGTSPPTTLMTGITTQLMIDVADVIR
jgi:uncharacterized membrane protein YoaK (UPF0700 family)